jgi:putative SOS response-associated peptidase YedK
MEGRCAPIGNPTASVSIAMALCASQGSCPPGTPEGGEPRLTCAILTRSPSKTAAQIHDRMAVILPDAAHHEWLDGTPSSSPAYIERPSWILR